MMDINRYTATRSEIIELWTYLKTNIFYMFFPTSAKMSLDQLENFEYQHITDAPDPGFIRRPVLQKVTIEELIDILPNIQGLKQIGYRNPKDAIPMYEKIQRYITLWMDILNETPEFATPSIKELYGLESVAQWAFTHYKEEVLAQEEREREGSGLDTGEGMLAFIKLLQQGVGGGQSELSFVSHLDNRLPPNLKYNETRSIEDLFTWDNP